MSLLSFVLVDSWAMVIGLALGLVVWYPVHTLWNRLRPLFFPRTPPEWERAVL